MDITCPSELTYAAEALGDLDRDAAVDVLRFLLTHESPVVREGAIYGLAKLRTDLALNALRRITEEDPVDVVRHIAKEALDDG